ncbi:ragulator complex protein LAMTOR1 [Hydra vulgaris]|uniref:Ragulator complex protein LAMTOR1 n=1 Tax=Hydra vulgaris TaxID=6087 RepID=A0ABM4D4M7_HYDVU
MGCICCKEKNSSAQKTLNDDEHDRLLDHDQLTPNRGINEDGNPSSLPSLSKTDEQSILSRILHKTAQNIIDVSAIEPHSIERSEYMEQMKNYLDKYSRIDLKLPKLPSIPSVTNNPVSVLVVEAVPFSDIKLITEYSQTMSTALSQMKIGCKESLVAKLEDDTAAAL